MIILMELWGGDIDMRLSVSQIWIFYLQDGFCGGIIIANSEEEAFKKLAFDRGATVEQMKGFTSIVPFSALDLNKDVHDLW